MRWSRWDFGQGDKLVPLGRETGGVVQIQVINDTWSLLVGVTLAAFSITHRRTVLDHICITFVESAVSEIVAKHMNKKHQTRWSRASGQPFLDVRAAVPSDTLEDAFRHGHPSFQPANHDHKATAAAA